MFPSDVDLLTNESEHQRVAVVLLLSEVRQQRHLIELHLLLTTAGYNIHSRLPATPILARVFFLFLDLRQRSHRQPLQPLSQHMLTASTTTIIELVDSVEDSLYHQFPLTCSVTTVITCVGLKALREVILYSQCRKSRYSPHELSQKSIPNVMVRSDGDSEITSVMF